MSNNVELTRLKIAADVLADVDRRNLFRDEAEELDDLEDRLLALASRLSDTRRDSDFASGLRSAIELPN
jgi:hypothetical protein